MRRQHGLATSNMAARSLRGGSGANELVVAMFWAQDFRASMMFRFWDGLRAEIEKTARPVRLVIYRMSTTT